MTWEQTDDLQFVKRIDEDNFKIIETTNYPDDSYSYGVIDIMERFTKYIMTRRHPYWVSFLSV